MECEGVASGGGLQRLCGQNDHKAPEGSGHQRAGPTEGSERTGLCSRAEQSLAVVETERHNVGCKVTVWCHRTNHTQRQRVSCEEMAETPNDARAHN